MSTSAMMSEDDPAMMTQPYLAEEDYNVTSLNRMYTNETFGMYEFYQVPQIVLVSLLCVFIIVGNSCVLAAIRLSENGRKSRMNFFIMHLALADLLVGVMVSLTDLAMKITIEWYAGNVMCKLFQYSQAAVTYASTYMLVSLSIDRYDAVARPMNFSRSGPQGRFLVFAAWLVSFVFAIPALFLYSETVQEGKVQCWMDFPQFWHWQLFVTAVTVVTFLIPAIIIAACYIAIIYIIWSKGRYHDSRGSNERMNLNQTSGSSTPTRLTISDSRHDTGRGIIPKARIRTIKMTLIIVIVFILCWSPFFLYNLLDIYGLVPIDNKITTLIQSAAPLNSAANPIIYGIFSTRICKNLRRIPMPSCLRALICHCKESRKCKRRAFGGRHHNYHTSQTTDPTMVTNDVHRRSKEALNDMRIPPTKPRHLRNLSAGMKNVLDRRIFFENCGEFQQQKDQDKKAKVFKGRKWSFEKGDQDYELSPLSRANPKQAMVSSGSDDSSPTTSDSHIRSLQRATKNDTFEHNITEPLKSMADKAKMLKLNKITADDNVHLDKQEMGSKFDQSQWETETDLNGAQTVSVTLTSDFIQKETRDEPRCTTNENNQVKSILKEGNETNYCNGVNTNLQQEVDGQCGNNTEVNSPTKGEANMKSTNGKPLNGATERSLANRRPSGVPSVRRRLTSDDDVILSNIASQWLVNDITANESSVVE